MTPPPIALALHVCEKIIVEQRTTNVTLVSTFTKLVADEFPTPPQRLAAYSVLTGGLGEAIIKLVVTRLETSEDVYEREALVRFPDRLAEARVLFDISQCRFPVPGAYQFMLLVDGEWVAQRQIKVALKGG